MERADALLNKVGACYHCLMQSVRSARKSSPAGLGGEGRGWMGVSAAVASAVGLGALGGGALSSPAGHGGEGWRKLGVTRVVAGQFLCFLLWASMLLLASLGGEGEKERSLRLMQGSYPSGAAGELLECKDSLRLGAPWWSSSSSSFGCCLFMASALWILRRPNLLRVPPPIRGRNDESDGGSLVSDGVGDESSAVRYYCSFFPLLPLGAVVAKTGGEDGVSSSVKQLWSWEAVLLSITSAAGCCRPTSKATIWPIQKPVKGSDISLTSFVRPLSRFAAALDACTEASGLVPASGHGGGVADLRLGGGEREGPDCVSSSASEVFSANVRDPCVVYLVYGVLCNVLYVHRLD